MMSTTHIVIGIAAALTVTQPDSAEALLPGIAGASVGSIICDIDCRGKRTGGSRSRMLRDAIIGRVIVAGLLVAVLFIDYWLGSPIFTRINNLTPAFLIELFVFIVCCGFSFLSEHRGFSHSIIALGLYSGSLYVMITPVTVPFAIAFISHVLLDLFNRKPVRVLWPLKKGWCLKIFYADRKANTGMLIAGSAWLGVVILGFLRV